MTDLISKSAIVDRLSEEAKRLEELSIHSKGQAADYYTGRKNGFAKAAIIANNFPTIDPVKPGRWQITEAYPHNVYCSACHAKYAQTHWAVWEDGSLPRHYCPNCGARMDL